jgi:DNA-binding response OmpR family regulator
MAQKAVLVVEDDDLVAEYLNAALSEQGYAVLGPVSTGEDAIDRARAQNSILFSWILSSPAK